MRCKADSQAMLFGFAFVAVILVVVRTTSTTSPNDSFFFYHFGSRPPLKSPSVSSSSSTKTRITTATTASTAPSPLATPPSPPLSRAEEKWQRWMKNLHDAVDDVMRWREKGSASSSSNLAKIEMELARVRGLIKDTDDFRNTIGNSFSSPSANNDDPDDHFVPKGSVYNDASAFQRSYLLMEMLFKVFVYEEGEVPIFHTGPCRGIYSVEGIFMGSLEKNARFRTSDPGLAHAFFLPFSVTNIIQHLFDPVVRDKAVLERTVVDYVRLVSGKYPYWNRSIGLDHFMLSCHDWGHRASFYHPLLRFHSIRALCNANTSEYFNPKKDVSIPEINYSDEKEEEHQQQYDYSPPSNRSILAFFAGGLHGHIRPLLFRYWKDNNDIQVFESLPAGASYRIKMQQSRYCLCPSGYEVASPRIVEAIHAGCVPVLISISYVLPFGDVLDWRSFSVRVSVEEIPLLKDLLMRIPDEDYLRLRDNVRRVARHFTVNDPPKTYDVFHMILHSIWLRRLDVRIL